MTPSESMITIITPSYNQAAYIEQTIQSVLRQDYARVEHIVMDGGSTDGTVDILKRYPHLIWRSEKDRGQADALNKGLALAKGDIIGWINSDDYYQEDIFSSVVEHFQTTGASWLVGRQADVFENGTLVVFKDSPKITFDALVRNPDIVRQQATFFKRDAIDVAGGWNVACYMVMDFDLWARLARISPPVMIEEDWAYFRNHGAQKSSLANVLRQAAEIAAVLRREQVSLPLISMYRAMRYWYWTKGLIKARLIDLGIVPARYRTRPVRQG
jgi:glycosyltransferase involved in cell wall biosynthesis